MVLMVAIVVSRTRVAGGEGDAVGPALTLRSQRVARRSILRASLFAMPLLDELIIGFPVLALPGLRDDLHLSYVQAGLLFTVGEIASFVFEPGLNLLSDRNSKRWPVLGGCLALALGFAIAASAPNLFWILLAFAVIFPAIGAAVGLAQATLIDEALHEAARTMTRWTFLASVGDLLAAPVVAGVLALGFGWRTLFWFAAALSLGAAAVLWPQAFPTPNGAIPEEDGDEVEGPVGGMLAGLRAALRHPLTLRWVAIALLASALDEIFLGFVALYLSDVVRLEAATVSLVLGAEVVGALAGLFLLGQRLDRWAPERLLRGLALVTLVGVAGISLSRSAWLVAAALFVVGCAAAGWYPLAQAGAYATLPGRSGAVRAVVTLFGAPFAIGLPLVVGGVAGVWGIAAAVGLLGLAPVAVLLLTPASAPASP